jgi:deoxycytidylate deaminase
MIATVYRPESLKYVDKNHNILISKTSVALAKDDEQSAIKALFKTACKTQGMDLSTNVMPCRWCSKLLVYRSFYPR